MAKFPAPIILPPHTNPIRIAGNGAKATANAYNALAQASNSLIYNRRKLVAHGWRFFSDTLYSTAPTGTNTCWFRFRSGVGTNVRLAVECLTWGRSYLFAPGTGGKVDLVVNGSVAASYFRDDQLNRAQDSRDVGRAILTSDVLTPNTNYEAYLELTGDLQVLAWVAYETCAQTLDTASQGVVDQNAVARAQPILASHEEDLITGTNDLLKYNTGTLAYCSPQQPTLSYSTTSTSWACPVDTAWGPVNMTSDAPCYVLDTRYLVFRGDSQVRVRLSCLANTSSSSNGEVGIFRVEDGASASPKLSITGIGTSATWQSTEGWLDPGEDHYMFAIRNTGGQTTYLYAAMLELVDLR